MKCLIQKLVYYLNESNFVLYYYYYMVLQQLFQQFQTFTSIITDI